MLKKLRQVLGFAAVGLALLVSGAAEAQQVNNLFMRLGRAQPNVYSTATITDNALKGSSGAYLDGFSMALANSDWCIFFTANLPATASADSYIFSMGALNNSILTASNQLNIGFPGNGSNAAFNMAGIAVSGKDSGGNWISPKALTLFGSAVQALTGPQQRANTPDAVTRTYFVQRKNGKFSIWIVDPAQSAQQYNEQTPLVSFGAITSVPVRLGARGRATVDGFSAVSYERFGKIQQALTGAQMEAIASGVDPRQVKGLSFSAANDDVLFAFTGGTPTAGVTTYTDLISGKVADVHGTFQAAADLVPTTIQRNRARINIQRYQTVDVSSGSLYLTGTSDGLDGEIEIRFTNSVNGTEQVAYQTYALDSGGRWSAIVPWTQPLRTAGYRIAVRKKIAGVSGTENWATATPIQVGRITVMIGQSLGKQWKTNNNYTPTGIGANTLSLFAYGDGIVGVGNDEGIYATAWSNPVQAGYGEGIFYQYTTNTLGYVMGMANMAKSGSTIDEWLDTTAGSNYDRLKTFMLRYRASSLLLNQGQQNTGMAPATYTAKVAQLYAMIRADFPWVTDFGVMTLGNTYSVTQTASQWNGIRQAHSEFIDDRIAANDNVAYLAANTNDSPSTSMNASDGLHKLAVATGYGFDAERSAQSFNARHGGAKYSGIGPKAGACKWDGAKTIRVYVTQNGGTGLQTLTAGNITGLEVSANGFSSNIAIISALITGTSTFDIVLSAAAGAMPSIRYQYGLPGPNTGGALSDTATQGLANPVNDNRTAPLNGTAGFPMQPIYTSLLCTAA